MKKLLFYSHDSYGLGNIRRMVAIASYLVSRHQDICILILTGSPMYHAFRTHPQIDYVKLPCLSRDNRGQYHSRLNCFDSHSLKTLRAKLILSTYQEFQPDLCLIDKKPTGLAGELNEVFTNRSLCSLSVNLLLLRDILDAPEKTSTIWEKRHYQRVIEEHYDEVLVVGEQTVFDVAKEYRFSNPVTLKTSYCGYLARKTEANGRCHSQDRRRILVSAGGGDDGAALFNLYLDSLENDNFPHNVTHHFVFGPEMGDHDVEQLISRAQEHPHITWQRFSDNFIELVQSADLVLSMAGYNTVCELMSIKARAILVPRFTPVEEQLIRAQRLSTLTAMDYLSPSQHSAQMLAEKVRQQLNTPKPYDGYDKINLRGMEVIEDKILSYLVNH
ncbi:glycosyltransferase family protein [Vibrio sinaloensis]|nr:glycosyltransferase [Vibrio sinaloensis]